MHTNAHTHTHTHNIKGQRGGFSVKPLCLSVSFCPWVEIFPGLYNFPASHAILVVTTPIYLLHVDIPSSSMLPIQFTRYFRWGIGVLFTLGNRRIPVMPPTQFARHVKGIFKSIFNRRIEKVQMKAWLKLARILKRISET